MGVLMKCDFCGEVFDGDPNARFVISVGEQLVFAGYLCPKCSNDLIGYVRKKLGIDEEKKKK